MTPRCSSRRTRWCTADTDRPTRSARSVKLARPSRARAASSARSTSTAGAAPPAPGSAGEFDELTGTVVEVADAVLGADDDVLDARTAAAGEIDAGLDRERHAGLEGQRVARHDVGRLVGVQPD